MIVWINKTEKNMKNQTYTQISRMESNNKILPIAKPEK